ncbi:MAG: hypothetical protein JWQ54_2735 [Mucilaginibacter sp.]|nr:hypothetical protein [Mucilaginibacter sp.]
MHAHAITLTVYVGFTGGRHNICYWFIQALYLIFKCEY